MVIVNCVKEGWINPLRGLTRVGKCLDYTICSVNSTSWSMLLNFWRFIKCRIVESLGEDFNQVLRTGSFFYARVKHTTQSWREITKENVKWTRECRKKNILSKGSAQSKFVNSSILLKSWESEKRPTQFHIGKEKRFSKRLTPFNSRRLSFAL